MDYEKKYKEALKKAREYKSKGYFLINSALESIFPELKENEDERIREEIVDYLKKFIPHHDYDLVAKSKQWIAWLEKQGEQKPAWSEEDEEMRKKLLFLMEEENSISSWEGCYEWLKSIMR